MLKKIMLSGLALGIFYCVSSCGGKEEPKLELPKAPEVKKPAENPYKDAKIEVKTFKTDEGWGYDIQVWGSNVIHQPSRPGLPGNKGFETETDAKKVGDFVAKKVKNNEMPPTISIDEMKKLGVLK